MILLGLSLIFPGDGLLWGDSIKLEFTTLADLGPKPDSLKSADVSYIISGESLGKMNPDSLLKLGGDAADLSEEMKAYLANLSIQQKDLTMNVLETFYSKIEQAKLGGKKVRILHFGDSQIEGDRITGVIRQKFQEKFGGCGIGLVPLTEASQSRISVHKSTSSNWVRHDVFGKRDTSVPHNRFGILGYIFRFTPWAKDSMKLGAQQASITLRKNKNYFKRAQKYQTLRLWYGQSTDDVAYEVTESGKVLASGNLDSVSHFGQLSLPVSGDGPSKIELRLTAEQGPEVFGVSLDCEEGVAVDNISWRGSSGLEFTRMDRNTLKAQLDALDPSLIIYQFGINVVPTVVDNYDFYENMVYRELKRLKSLNPDIPVLVVGVSDMSRKEKGEYVSFPNIELIRDAQKKAAFRTGCAFWDLYEVMGGRNSMPNWVNAKKPLASKDYTHFNPRGAKLVGEKLFNAIMTDYDEYKGR